MSVSLCCGDGSIVDVVPVFVARAVVLVLGLVVEVVDC